MNRIKLICVLCFLVFGVAALFFDNGLVPAVGSYSSQPPPGMTGAPGEQNCSLCHDDPPGPGSITITAPANYVPGQTYQIQVQHATTDATRMRWGFEATALDGANAAAGTFTDTTAFTQQDFGDGRFYIEHNQVGTFAGTSNGATWTFDWNAPATNIGPVTFYAAGNQANNNNNPNGDHVFLTTTVSQPIGPTPTNTPTPICTPGTTGTLYDQSSHPSSSPVGVVSQDAEAAFDEFDQVAADDFVVPAGQVWNISEVVAIGLYEGSGPAAGFHVAFYQDSGTLPGGPVAGASFTSVPFTAASGEFTITLPSTVVLSPGAYWVSIQARQDFKPAGTWQWANRIIGTNSGAAWQNPGNGVGTGCTTWGRKTTCLSNQNGRPDQLFRLVGTTCGTPTPTATATPTCTPGYTVTTSTGQTIVPGTTGVLSFCDDCAAPVTLPFPFVFYGTTFTSATLVSNGNLQFTGSNLEPANLCLPNTTMNNLIAPYWDDLRFSGGIEGLRISTTGTAPNRIFNIEWTASFPVVFGAANFEIRLHETTNVIDFVYGPMTHNGGSATVGLQKGTGPVFDQFGCIPAGLSNGMAITFTPTNCGPPPSISGTITYGNAIGNPVPPRFLKNVSVASTAGSPPVGPVITGTPGTYALTGFGAGSYTIKPTKPGGATTAITSNDAARVAQGVTGSLPFVSQNQRFAADVSGNGGVSSQDAAKIAQFVAGLPFSPPNITGQWKFFVTGAPSPLPTPPQVYDDSRSYASVTTNLTGEDFVGILVGEVSGNWNPATHPRPVGSRQLAEGSQDSDATEKPITVTVEQVATKADKEIVVPVNVAGVIGKDIISYEFDLRYDPAVIQPLENSVEVKGTVSRGLFVVTNPYQPGLLRVVVYGPMPIDEDGVLLNLRFTAVGAAGSVSPLTFERIMFNEGETAVVLTDGRVALSQN